MSKETSKTKMTKEELAQAWKEYYEKVEAVYPIKSLTIQGKGGEKLDFFPGFNIDYLRDSEHQTLLYLLKDEQYKEAYEKQKEDDLQGKSRSGKSAGEIFKTKAFIDIRDYDKVFNFGVDWDYQGLGYGKVIYDNYLHILEILGIKDKEQYELRIYNNPNHDFFKKIQTMELVKKASGEPNTEKALQLLQELAAYSNPMRFREFNSIIEYAINSNVSYEEITKAINANGFNITYGTVNRVPNFEKEDIEQYKSFGITGLKATCMHDHFIKGKNFGFMMLLENVDTQDATLEFRNIFEEIKSNFDKEKEIFPHLKNYGVLEHIILDWYHSGLLFKHVTPEIKELIKKQAISRFDEFDPKHNSSWGFQVDYESNSVLLMLSEAGLMDKDAYIQLYQKALNRNYNLEDFDKIARRYINKEERNSAREEISKNAYYPSPKKTWQRSYPWGKDYRIQKISIPIDIMKNGEIRAIIKQQIIDQGIAKNTKIKTTMTGTGKDGKPFEVDNLKDWLFGVPGARGNLQITANNNAIVFPPQTPEFAVKLVEQALSDLVHPVQDER